MGQSTSKPLSSKVYENAEVKIDKGLRNELESSPETDVVRKLYKDKYIEDQIAKKLYEERIAAQNAIKDRQSQNSYSGSGLSGNSNDESSLDMRKKVQELHKELANRPRRGKLDSEGNAVREKLVNCLTENKDHPLNCREVFVEFQDQVSRVEKKIASQ